MCRLKPFWVFLLMVLGAFTLLLPAQQPVLARGQLLFCNRPEKITASGTHADAMLRAGKSYTIFFHYKNTTSHRDNLVIALSGDSGTPLSFTARRGFGDAQRDPTLAGRQAMARYLSAPDLAYRGKKGAAHFAVSLGSREIGSGLMTVTATTDARLRIYWRHNKWSVRGARVVAVDSPRRQVEVALTKGRSGSYRIGVPDAGMSRYLDGTYGMLYSFKVAAPKGSRVRVSFCPRGGKAGMVGSVNGSLHQSRIIGATKWTVLCETVVGSDGLTLTTAPFGGVFYPVELAFRII